MIDLDALLARADNRSAAYWVHETDRTLIADLAAAVRDLQQERDTALAIIRKQFHGEYPIHDGTTWWWGNNPDYDPDAYMADDATRAVLDQTRQTP